MQLDRHICLDEDRVRVEAIDRADVSLPLFGRTGDTARKFRHLARHHQSIDIGLAVGNRGFIKIRKESFYRRDRSERSNLIYSSRLRAARLAPYSASAMIAASANFKAASF